MATVKGGVGIDTKYGTASADLIYGYDSGDSLYGRAGDDQVWGGNGSDKLWGEAGNDKLWGDANDDTIYAGDGNDIVYGGSGNDTMYGDAGTDTLKGEAGNDVMKGGTGISYMFGGDGNDTMYYNPSSSTIESLGTYLSGSVLYGDAGYDTVHLFNETKYKSGTTLKPTETLIEIEERKAHITFDVPNGDWDSPASRVATLYDVEKIVVTDPDSPVFFIGDLYGNRGVDITGGDKNDTLQSFYASDTLRGGKGNDTFFVGGGTDKIYSEANDADTITFNGWGGTTEIRGFNGAGVHGGDRIEVPDYYIHDLDAQMKVVNGNTEITMDSGDFIKIIGVTNVELGVDIFLV